ncbi:apoptotic chromatin condensation inducer 1b [Denticeps clupeoides]|uniref:Apoptotic chromatin condensation inducer 1b n=1 Tax=Denticeps clupeoides TaxID=299321 RepID=A0AAY4A3T0_9TELE|nr:apoptotic chromatin condensation inducer in the nucleus-like [Denticeps clupeoides]
MAELEDVTLDGKPLHSLRVADLKCALEKRGLPKSGQKSQLIKRLKGALMLENLQRTSTPHAGLQPNSQIGEEMTQNSFIQQYLAKQQEILQQRLEREAAEANETDSPAGAKEEDHAVANDGTSHRQEHHALARGEQEGGVGRGGSMADSRPAAPDDCSGRIWRPSFLKDDPATPSPPRAVASLSVRVVGEPERQGLPLHLPRPPESYGTAPAEPGSAHSIPQHSRSARAASRSQDESDDDDDDDDDESEEDEDWGPAKGKRGSRGAPQNLQPTPQRSRRKLQPPQHIPPQPVLQPPMQHRQPTPPPSPPPEPSFPLPDTPKQSPPDLHDGAGPADAVVGAPSPPAFQRQDSSSSSRSSSPEPRAKRRPGPLSLLVRKMESEGEFDGGAKTADIDTPLEGPGASGGVQVSARPQYHGEPPGPAGTIKTCPKSQGPEAMEESNAETGGDSAALQQAEPPTKPSALPPKPLLASPSSSVPTPPPLGPKRRTFTDFPLPESLSSPTKGDPEKLAVPPASVGGAVVVSGPRSADASDARGTGAAVVAEEDENQSVKGAAAGPPSQLPPSPPPEAAGARRKRKPEQTSPSSDSSSSDSDSGSSSSPSSASSPSRHRPRPPSQKKGRDEEKNQLNEKVDQRKHLISEVSQADLSESGGVAAMEMMEGPREQPSSQGEPESSEGRPDENASSKGFVARRISLSSNKTSPISAEPAPADSDAGGAGKKRRWGSSASVTAKKASISISTDSLKSLIPDVKLPLGNQEAVVDLYPEEGRLSGDEAASEVEEPNQDKDLKIRRTVTQVVPPDAQENGQNEQGEEDEEKEKEPEKHEVERKKARKEERKDSASEFMEAQSSLQHTESKKVTPSDTMIRRSVSQQKSGVSITIDDPVRAERQPSPPRGKISKIIHVSNLVRPFTLGQLKELLNRTGTMVEEGFWIDKIKSHCYVTYSSTDEAMATRDSLHGVKWPLSNPKVLSVDFCEQDELDFHRGLLTTNRSADDRAPPAPARAAPPPPLMTERERGPAAGVRDQWAEREREMERRERTRSEREWDRDKVREFRKPGEERDGRRSQSRERERRHRERGKSREKKSEKKVAEKAPDEPPAKLLDDLFRKTKTAPCIYWLPLTEEQVVQRVLERAERMKEREKKRKELQEEEDKKREEERKERSKGREKEGGGGAAPAAAAAAAASAGGGGGGGGAPSSRAGEKERDHERAREKERERGRDRESDRRRDDYRQRGAESKASGGAGPARRSRSRSNPSRDRRH